MPQNNSLGKNELRGNRAVGDILEEAVAILATTTLLRHRWVAATSPPYDEAKQVGAVQAPPPVRCCEVGPPLEVSKAVIDEIYIDQLRRA